MSVKTRKLTNKMRLEMLDFAKEIGAVLSEGGEVGFGRPCVGFLAGSSYVDYGPAFIYTGINTSSSIEDLDDPAVYPPREINDAYHKHECFCILAGHGTPEEYENALIQLHIWVKHLKSQGGIKLVHYGTGATGVQAIMGGIVSTAMVTRKHWDKLAKKPDLHPNIPQDQFTDIS